MLAFGSVTASKIFLLFAIFLHWAGPAAFVLQYANKSPSAWIICAALIPWLLAGTFYWGFVNYYPGVRQAFL